MKTKFQIPVRAYSLRANSKFSSRKARKGFTLIEILIVVTITAILATVGTISYNGAIKKDQLDSYSKEIMSSLEKARTKAINQEEGDSWGVRLEANTSSAFSNFAIFKGTTSGTDFIDVKKLNTNINFTEPAPGGATPIKEIVFNKSTGTVKDGVNHFIQIGSGSITKDIYINKNGLISLGVPSSVEALPVPTLNIPSDGTIIGLNTSQTVSWATVTGAQKYGLQVSTDINFGSLFFENSAITSTSYNVTGLQPYTIYYWRVNAYSLLTGNSLWSSVRSFGTLIVPSAPQSPNGSPANGKNILVWSAPSASGGASITGYKIYWGTISGTLSSSISVGNVLNYDHTGLTNGTIYYYKVAAINLVGEGIQTSEFSSTPQALPEPGTVTLTYSYNNYVGSPFSISIPFTSLAAITSCQYTINGGTNWTAATVSGTAPNFTCSVAGVTSTEGASLSISMRATNSGGTNTPIYTSKTVDATIPTATDSWTDAWTATSPVTITLTPSDGSGSGISTTKYCVDTANTCTPSTGTTYVSPFSVTCASGSACTQYVRYATWDNVNNASAISSKLVRQDTQLPTVTDNWTDNWTFISPLTITLTPSDGSGSGISTTKYCVDTINTCTPSTGTAGTSVSVTCAASTCTQYVRYQSTDNLGSLSAVNSKTVRHDTQLPTVTDNWTDNWTMASPVTITLTPTDGAGSGIATTKYCVDTTTSQVNVLVVGGGGGGGADFGGGGGAGGFRYYSSFSISAGAISVTVGNGGTGATNEIPGTSGQDSIFSNITAAGGGMGGGSRTYSVSGSSGGGGGGYVAQTYGVGANGNAPATSPLQGNNGGNGYGINFDIKGAGGGGGGAGVLGTNAIIYVGGVGGAGIANSISGSSVTYAGGGGGGAYSPGGGAGGAGGAGGGGAGGTTASQNGTNGTANTGGGGGGNAGGGTGQGGSGGSGIVIISYPTGSIMATGGTITTNGSETIHTFTTSGTFNVTAINVCNPSAGTVGTSVSVTCASGSACTQYVRYAAWDVAGNASAVYSETVKQDTQAPTNPTLTATPGSTQIALSWTAATDVGSGLNATTPYKVVFATGATPPADCNTGTVVSTTTATTATHTGLTNGTQYSYRVCAIDALSNMSTGGTGSATPQRTTVTFITTTGLQYWTTPVAGNYTIVAQGAQGGCTTGGNGASMSGDLTIASGTQLKILVGGQGTCATTKGGGGGGSFVVKSSDNSIYVIAGGGGGAGSTSGSYYTGTAGTTATSGTVGKGCASNGGVSGGGGGRGTGTYGGGGGGGYSGNGVNGPYGNGGIAFTSGGAGGTSSYGNGGIGGGGGNGNYGGGGGGGYSGGGGGLTDYYGGGGGGSYNNGTNQVNTSGARTGNGIVTITYDMIFETTTTSTTTTTTTLPALAIGDTYGGGKVAYILQAGDPGYVAGQQHGLIAAAADQGTSTWGVAPCYGTDIAGADGIALGTGHQNTHDMIAVASCTNAAQLVHGVTINGYSDWYLPSIDELNKLYLNRAAIGGFATGYYWSSSEDSAADAWHQIFTDGGQDNGNKTTTGSVRAVRGF